MKKIVRSCPLNINIRTTHKKTYIAFLYFNTAAITDMFLLTAYEDIPGNHCDIAAIHTKLIIMRILLSLCFQLIYRLAKLCQNNKLLNKKKKKGTQNDEEGEQFMSENGTTIELKEEVAKEQNGVRPKQESTAETNLNKDHLLPPSSNGGLKRAPSHMERARRLHTRQKRGQSVSFTHENMRKKKPPINDETEEGLQGLFHHLKIRQDKMRTEFQETAKWFKVATKMDRIFFWGYGISVTILTFYAFIFKPMQKNVEL